MAVATSDATLYCTVLHNVSQLSTTARIGPTASEFTVRTPPAAFHHTPSRDA